MHYYAFSVNKIPVGVLGASGYAGRELCALVLRHPMLSLAFFAGLFILVNLLVDVLYGLVDPRVGFS